MIRNKPAVLRRCPVFQGASPATVRSVAAAATPRVWARRAPLWAREHAGDVVIVGSGVIRESVGDGDRMLTLGFWGRGALVGAECLTSSHISDAEAYEECSALHIPSEALREHARQDAGLALGLFDAEARRRLLLQRLTEALVTRSAIQRLAAVLLELAQAFGVRDSRGTIINLRLTHKELAGLIGATRETVSFAVSDLRQQSLIENDGKRVVVLDKRGLQKLARVG